MSLTLGLMAMMAAPAGGAAAAQPSDIVLYRVRRGDTLFTLGERYFIRADSYRRVQRLNRIADPHRLPIGRTLRVPRALLRTEPVRAEVVAFRGAVSIGGAGGVRQAALGMPVGESAVIATAAKGFVTLMLPDDSRISLPSGARVRIDRLRRTLLTGEVVRAFSLESGTSDWEVTPSAADPFTVTTPIATTAVRGTGFRVSHDEAAHAMTVGVLEGSVDVGAEGVSIPAGTGAAVGAGGSVRAAALLAAPDLLAPGATQRGETLAFAARPVTGANGYAFEIATDAGFIDRLARVRVAAPSAELESIESGTYFVRVSAFDADGIEGRANTYSFERSLNTIETEAAAGGARAREYLFRWRGKGEGTAEYRFILSHDEAGEDRLVDRPGLTETNITVSDLPKGSYYWRIWSIRFEKGKYSETVTPPQRLQIGEVP